MSQWGHNFRPSYLKVRSLLPLIEPKSILALTATAVPMVVRDICNTLRIPFDGHRLVGEVSLQSPAAPTEASATFDNDGMDSDGVKILNCDRDNIDVFSLVLQNNDERRYLVSSIHSFPALSLIPVLVILICYQHASIATATQNIEGKEGRKRKIQKAAHRRRLSKQRECYHLRMATEGY